MLSYLISLLTSPFSFPSMGKTKQALSGVVKESVKKLTVEDVHLLYSPKIDMPLLNSMLSNLGIEKTDSILSKLEASTAASSVSLIGDAEVQVDGLSARKAFIEQVMKSVQARDDEHDTVQVVRDCKRCLDQMSKYNIYSKAIESVWMASDDPEPKQAIDEANIASYKVMIEFYLEHFLSCDSNIHLSSLVKQATEELLIGKASMGWLNVTKEAQSQALMLLVLHTVLAEYIRPYYAMEINTGARYAAMEAWCRARRTGGKESGALLEVRVPDEYYAPLCEDDDDDDDVSNDDPQVCDLV